jgi:alanine racemase
VPLTPSSFTPEIQSERVHRCWAEIDLDALRHNASAVRARIPAGAGIMAVIKANAYGHGVRPVARALHRQVEMFGVANVREAGELDALGLGLPIYILGPALPQERAEIARRGFIPALSTLEEAASYNELTSGRVLPVHLTVDTGMGRIGVWKEEAHELCAAIRQMPNLKITGIASHLPVADEDDAFTREQLREFASLQHSLNAGATGVIAHVHNSAGIIGFPENSASLVRAGLMLYGSAPLAEFQPQLKAVMTWKTRVTLVRDVGPGRGISYGRTFIATAPMRVATLGVGYADGYQRHLSNRGAEVLICGRRCPVLGRVTMDQIMVDTTALPAVGAGEEVVLLGRQGGEEILAAELAERSGTIPWEIFTGVGSRVERIYRGAH